MSHRPIIEPCLNGRFKLRCGCGWKPSQRFRSFRAAEVFWTKHVNEEVM